MEQQTQFQASISPITNSDHPFVNANPSFTNNKDKQQFAAYKNFVKNIQSQHKLKLTNSHQQQKTIVSDKDIIQQTQKQFISTKHQQAKFQQKINNVKPSLLTNQFNKFTEFIQKKNQLRNKIKTASSCTNLRIAKNNQHFKISHMPSTAKLATQVKIKNLSPQQPKGKPYIDKKPRRQLVLKQQKQNSTTIKQPKMFQEIKLRVQKLPELKSEVSQTKKQIQKPKIQEFKDVQAIIKKKKLQKLKNDLSLSPILKTYDMRYFGLDSSKSMNFQKMGQQLLYEVKNKYWCFDNIQNEEVYENFEHFLCSNLHK